jgi:6-phosphogluconolactonase (cycloisomerase 2 family)
VLALAAVCSLTACDNDYTLAFVYAPSETTTTSGLINAYGIDNQTGKLRLLADSPIPSGGRKPVAIAVAPNQKFLYVINHDDSNVVELSIGTDGKLYPQNTYNTTGSYPVALAVSADGKYLYVAYTYQVGYTTESPGPGGISVFPIASDNSLGTPTDFPIGRTPVAITVSNKPLSGGGNAVYVASQDAGATNPSSAGTSTETLNLFAFSANASNGMLSTLPGETIVSGNAASSGYATGAAPGGLLEDAGGTHLYVTDSTGNHVITYSITGNGVPAPVANGTAATGAGPLGMVIDPSGKYLYIANSGSGTISGYTFDASGDPVPSTVAATTQAGTGTNCVTIEPTHGIYLYASGLISNSITGEQIIPADGSLKPIIGSPYAATTLPVCAVAVARF